MTPQPGAIRVAIIEDQTEIRQSLGVLIDGTPGYRATGSFGAMEAALDAIVPPLPDVVLADIGLPGMSGIEGIRLLKQRYPGLHVIVLTVYDDDKRIFDAICAGACGYLLKTTPPARLLEGIREVLEGGAPMSPSVARRVIALFQAVRPPVEADYHLTPHESRLLKLLVEGHNFKSAAAEIGVTTHAISFHMRRVYEKLQVHSKTEAVAKALRHKIV
ncbi:MAG: response regulator transcription factor [Acidobacteria bacterium]|nr:response regulator transcription factor [Acidobacteriota bacterium]